MLDVLTGTGLATSAGLNAYIPLLVTGLLGRYVDSFSLPAGWQWLESGPALIVIAVLLVIELVADKIPIVDSVNDVIQTAVRPTAGGLVFGASAASDTTAATGGGGLTEHYHWIPVVVGVVLALIVHAAKSLLRPVINAFTAGLGAPAASLMEDGASLGLSILAIVAPILALFGLIVLVVVFVFALRKLLARKRRKLAEKEAKLRQAMAEGRYPGIPPHRSNFRKVT